MQEKFQNKSFTLIEMLVVVVIIGILAVTLVPRLVGARERASDSGRIVKIGQISSAVELYAQEKGTTYLKAPLTATGTSITRQDITDAISPYLTTIPTDPGKGTVAIQGEPGNIQMTGDSFAYWTNDDGTIFAITALMESKKGNTTNATQIIDSDKQGGYQKVGKGLTTKISIPGVIDTSAPGVYHDVANQEIIVTNGTKTYIMQDKNVGASVAGTGPDSYGYFFQWGNNHGFSSDTTVTYSPSSTGAVDTSAYNENNPYTSSTWIYQEPPYYFLPRGDWSTTRNNNLRPEGAQGPCPTGYHIPTHDEFGGLINVRASLPDKGITYLATDYVWFDNGDLYLFTNDFKLPRAGYRDYNSSGSVSYQGFDGYYWSSSPSGPYYTDNAYNLGFYVPQHLTEAGSSATRGNGFSIRCFKN